MKRIDSTALPDDIVLAIHYVVPRASVPVVITGEQEDPGSFHIQSEVEVIGKLI
jgi:hypothetical protein